MPHQSPARCSVVFASAALLASSLSYAADAPNYAQIVQDEAYWISLSQIPTNVSGPGRGGLAWYPDQGHRRLNPYIANRGAKGLLLAGAYYYPMVRAYADWYFRHLNGGAISGLPADYAGLSGTIYDWDADVASGAETYAPNPQQPGLPWYDSSDAYAATFLTLLRKWAEVDTTSSAYILANAGDIQLVANAAIATQHVDGLTGAKPDYPAEFLMDNVEVEQGLQDYAWLLENVFADGARAAVWESKKDALRDAIQTNMRTAGPKSMYCWAADQCGATTWSRFYSDSVSQAWPIQARLAPASTASALWSAFNASWPDWVTSVNATDSAPWAILAYTAATLGDKARVDAYINGSQAHWVGAGRPWPWTIADSADRAGAASLVSTKH